MTGRRQDRSEAAEAVQRQLELTDAVASCEGLTRAVTAARKHTVNLMVLHGFTWTDIARVTGLSVNTAKELGRTSGAR